MPIWLLLTFTAGLFDIAYSVLSRKFLNGSGKSAIFTWWFCLIRSIIFSYSIVLLPNLKPVQILYLLILGILNSLNLYLFMKMHEVTELSVSSIIAQLRIVWVPLLAVVLISEKLVFHEYLGIFLIFCAVLIIKSPRKLVFDKSVNTAFIFSITTSILTVLIKGVSNFSTPSIIIFAMSFPSLFMIPLFFKVNRLELLKDWKKTFHQKLILASLSILLIYAMVFAFRYGAEVGKVNAVTQSMSVLTAFFGIKFLGEEKDIYKKIIAILIILIGIYSIIY